MNVENQERPFKINKRQEAFCQKYCEYLNGTQAYMEVYRPKKGLTVARTNASKLLANTNIQNRIEEIRSFTAGKFNITRERIIKTVAKLAFADRRVLYDENNSLRNMNLLSEDEALQIEGVETFEERDKDGNLTGYTKKLKVSERTKSIEILNKMLGYNSPEKFEGKMDGELTGLLEIKIVPSEEQIDKTL